MNIYRNIHAISDMSFKYSQMKLTQRLHEWLGLKGKYSATYPTEVITKDMENLRMDGLYKVIEDMLVNLEAQSTPVKEKELKRFWKYRVWCEQTYGLPVLTVIICTADPDKCLKYLEITESDIIKPLYIFFSEKEVSKKYNNLMNKINNNEKLSDLEALDIAFLPLIAPSKKASRITEEMCEILKNDKNIDKNLKIDIAFILQLMIFKNIDDPQKREKLLEMIDMAHIDNDMCRLVREFYGDEIDEKVDEKVNEKEAEIKERLEVEMKERLEKENKHVKSVKTKIIREMECFDEKNGTYKELFENIVSCLALL